MTTAVVAVTTRKTTTALTTIAAAAMTAPDRTPGAPATRATARTTRATAPTMTRPRTAVRAWKFVRTARAAGCPRSGPVEGVWGNREVPPATTRASRADRTFTI